MSSPSRAFASASWLTSPPFFVQTLRISRQAASADGNFIDAVNPTFAIISASTRNHLPKPTTVARYEANTDTECVVLRTDDHTEADIMCFKDAGGKLDCNFLNVIMP
jgi:hypothetical protein